MSATNVAPSPQAFEDALQELYDCLNDAYWEATTIEGKDLISGCAQGVSDVLTQVHQQDFSARTPAFTQLADQVAQVNKKLTQLKSDIDKIIHRIDTATNVLGSIEKVINLAAPLFG